MCVGVCCILPKFQRTLGRRVSPCDFALLAGEAPPSLHSMLAFLDAEASRLDGVGQDGKGKTPDTHMAVGQNQWYHFGLGAPPILVYFSGDWDVHLTGSPGFGWPYGFCSR